MGKISTAQRLGVERISPLPVVYDPHHVGPPPFHPEVRAEFVQAYYAQRCVMSRAAAVVGISLLTARQWRHEDEAFADALDACDQVLQDDVKLRLTEEALTGVFPADRIFWLKHKHPEFLEKEKKPEVRVIVMDPVFLKRQEQKALGPKPNEGEDS